MPGWVVLLVIVAAVIAAILLFGRDRARRIGGGDDGPDPSPKPPMDGRGRDRSPDGVLSPEDRAEMERFIADGRKIHAIKLVREVTGLGLREAKEFVEDHERVLDQRGRD